MRKLSFDKPGNRTVKATYDLKWNKIGGLAAGSGGGSLRKQKVTIRFNVTDQSGELLKSIERSAKVSCKSTTSLSN